VNKKARDAERLLRSFEYGAAPDPEIAATRLGRLLANLPPPPPAGELPGEAAALAAFRQVMPEPAPAGRSERRRFLTRMARMFTTRAILVAVAATSIGGGSLALAAGKLPAPISPHHHRQQHGHPRHPHGTPGEHRRPTGRPTPSPRPASSSLKWPNPGHRGGHPPWKPGESRHPGPRATPTSGMWK